MDFQALQNKFAKKHLDWRTEWLAWWTDNLEALNDWYKEAYNKTIQDRSIQQAMKSTKTQVTMSGATWTLPSDLLQPVQLYFKSCSYCEVDDGMYPYRYIRTSWAYQVIFDETPTMSIYIEYIPQITELSANIDEITLPAEFENDVINYALVEYFRNQRDWGSVSNALQYAEWKIGETIANFWLE